ncbi:LemA protein [Maritalea mobilis]|uniref:LemA protein n=1 Tax=Maritalea mobilis TaxID=483324 RepID=A0A4R6VGL3_9HYPH|nr:LemA family protein [Maritalea mobilis]TDQ60426.1 LemA protein [Maritalea mobilis]
MFNLIIGVVILIGGYVYLQNRLAAAKNAVSNAYAGIQVQLKRRHDLVPALVDAVRSAIKHEEKLFDQILAVRQEAVTALDQEIEKVEVAEASLTQGLREFFAYAEDHPEITATQNISELQKQLEETEDQIAASRRLYNGNVERFNTQLDAIPSNWVAQTMRLEKAPFFGLSASEAKSASHMPKIDLPGAQS